jgi:predicted MPP superfamily phosphohydrolase
MGIYIGWALVSVLMAIVWFYLLLIVPTQWLKVERVRHSIGLGVKIVQLSDLHVEHIRIKPNTVKRLIEREKPDYVIVTGDFTQKQRYLALVEPYAAVLGQSGVPVYAVLGNHDHKLPRVQRLVVQLKRHGIEVLQNRHVVLGQFSLVGIDDFDSGRHRIRKSFEGVPQGLPVVVATHDPNIVTELARPFDYLMSGHLHGKQLNVPFLFRLRPAGPLPAQGIYKGLHRSEYGTYYISKGMSQTGFNIRFAVRSEATVHEL